MERNLSVIDIIIFLKYLNISVLESDISSEFTQEEKDYIMKQSELKRQFLKVTKRFEKFLGGFGRLATSNSDECKTGWDPSKQVCTRTSCKFNFYEQIGHISPEFDSLLDSIVRDSK
jgi:hypothetical protein